jgi:phytoene synthase
MTVGLFHTVSEECSRIVTVRYSTSFASAIRLLDPSLRPAIFNIYGFVRFADEIVDTLHDHDKKNLLKEFKAATFEGIKKGISMNPVLNSFQKTVNHYRIDHKLIHDFFRSMESDLSNHKYDRQGYQEYIYGSAEVVGLICLYVFCEGDTMLYRQLQEYARALGAAFQKVNFLRDMKSDFAELSRVYFPGFDFHNFTEADKIQIAEDIENDFRKAYAGILNLPMKARFGVYVAYKYYYSLFRKIKATDAAFILQGRIRIANYHKALIVFRASVKNGLGLI